MKVKHHLGIFYLTLLVIPCPAQIAQSNNKFARALYTALAGTNVSANVFFSPISVHAVLTLLHQGAKGSSEKVLRDVLHLPNADISARAYQQLTSNIQNTEDAALYFANGIFVQDGQPLKPEFQDAAEKYFMAHVQNINFGDSNLAAQKINTWVEKKTHDNIKDIVTADSIEQESVVLINALYFKAHWLDPFMELLTKVEKFYISNTETVNCDMMHNRGYYRYSENAQLDAKILKIPFKKLQAMLVIVLPNSRTGIERLEKKLVRVNLMSLLRNTKKEEVDLSLPKFKIAISMDLSQPLKELGLGPIFSDKAEFTDMVTSKEPLRVSSVLQKAFISINENGIEAGAASGVLLRRRRSVIMSEYEFKADRPFLFYIVDSNFTIIFLGKLMQPDPVIIHDEL